MKNTKMRIQKTLQVVDLIFKLGGGDELPLFVQICPKPETLPPKIFAMYTKHFTTFPKHFPHLMKED